MADIELMKQVIVDAAYDGDCTKAQLVEHLDALVAAVRAEKAAPITVHDIHRVDRSAVERQIGPIKTLAPDTSS